MQTAESITHIVFAMLLISTSSIPRAVITANHIITVYDAISAARMILSFLQRRNSLYKSGLNAAIMSTPFRLCEHNKA